jgi:hypothetical protein
MFMVKVGSLMPCYINMLSMISYHTISRTKDIPL